jgi:hypothetical protein
MTKLDAGAARRITRDWASAFPEFDAWRPLRLLRRIGPVVQGVTLDKSTSGEDYFPTAHVHALTQDFPTVSLTLSYRLLRLSGQPERISVADHGALFQEAAEKLREQSPLALSNPPSIDDIVGAYHMYAEAHQRSSTPLVALELEDSVLLAAAAGRPDLVDISLRVATGIARRWSQAPMGTDSITGWLNDLKCRAGDSAALAELIQRQIDLHKLDKIRAV